jgi:HEAT repeat protein
MSVALVVAAGAQAPQVQNARLESQAVTSLARDVAALASRTTDPVWVAWQVPMIDGERNLCCTYFDNDMTSGIRGCRMEPADADSPRTPPDFPAPTGPVQLEAGTKVTVFVRLVNRRIERLRALTDDCPVDAGGRALHWLTEVTGADSVAWLKATALDETLEFDVRTTVASAAVRALALHRDPSAVTVLMNLASAPAETPTAAATRKEAMQGLGQSRDPRALQFIQNIITR